MKDLAGNCVFKLEASKPLKLADMITSQPRTGCLIGGVLSVALFLAIQSSAQPCIHCPVEATAATSGSGTISVFAIQNGQTNNVSGGTVATCNQLIISASLAYNPFAVDAEGNPAVAAGFSGGVASITLPDGSAVDVTPADMSTTFIGPTTDSPGITHCTPSGGYSLVSAKPMIRLIYTITSNDIAAGFALFTFRYDGTLLLPNAQGLCDKKLQFSLDTSVDIAPVPIGSVSPATNNIGGGSSATFTANCTGAGPLSYSWTGPGGFTSTSQSIVIDNAQTSQIGTYTATVTDVFGCVTTLSGQLAVSPQFTSLQKAGSDLVLSGSGGRPNGSYVVMMAANPASSFWTPVSTNNFDLDGKFSFTRQITGTQSQAFFRLFIP